MIKNPFKKPTKSQIDREHKRKVEEDRTRTQDIKDRLIVLRNPQYGPSVPAEDIPVFNDYFNQAIQLADNARIVRFDCSSIDEQVLNIIEVLEHAKAENGSSMTIKRCFAGISYGLDKAHREIPASAIQADIIQRRATMVSRYFIICNGSFEVDKMNDELRKKKLEKAHLEELVEEKKKIVEDMAYDKPSTFNKLQSMTADERSKLTGEEHLMAAAMSDAINTKKSLENVKMQIGAMELDIVTVEQVNRSIYDQVRSWESGIDENTVAEILRQTKEFEKEELKHKELVKKLEGTVQEMNLAIDNLYAGVDMKEKMINIADKYDDMIKLEQRQQAEDEAGRIRLEQERQENEAQTNEENKKVILN